jgi:hypothetical protein
MLHAGRRLSAPHDAASQRGQRDATPVRPGFAVDGAAEPEELIPMAATPPPLALDTPAPDFRLPGTDGRTYGFDDIAGEHGTVVVFICNHCPT